jgi:hypothetical protein
MCVLLVDVDFHRQFTGQGYSQIIEPGAEASMEYKFMPSPQLDPITLQMALTVFYEDSAIMYGTTFFNGTVSFVDHSSPLDIRSSLKLVLVVGVIGVIIFALSSSNGKKSRRSKTTTTSTTVEGEFAESFRQRTVRRLVPTP